MLWSGGKEQAQIERAGMDLAAKLLRNANCAAARTGMIGSAAGVL